MYVFLYYNSYESKITTRGCFSFLSSKGDNPVYNVLQDIPPFPIEGFGHGKGKGFRPDAFLIKGVLGLDFNGVRARAIPYV